MGCLATSGAAALLLATPLGASGATTLAERPHVDAGVALAGRSVVWGEAGNRGLQVRWARPGVRARVLARVRNTATRRYSFSGCQIAFVASRSRLAFTRQVVISSPGVGGSSTDLVAGPLRGPFRPLPMTASGGLNGCGPDGRGSLDLSHRTLAFSAAVGKRYAIFVKRLGRRGRPARLVTRPVPIHGVRIAGRYLAWLEADSSLGRIVVFDRRAGRTAYSVSAQAASGFDVQPDGKLAVARGAGGGLPGYELNWYSRQRPRPRDLGFRATDPNVRMARDRIAFERMTGPESSQLSVTDLTGHIGSYARFRMTPAVGDVRRQGQLDFDGKRLAWSQYRVERVDPGCPPCLDGGPCPLRPCVLMEVRSPVKIRLAMPRRRL
jgi:hypothetical protein